MIEVLFGESEAGAMKCAKSNKKLRNSSDGPTSVWGDVTLLPPVKDWESVPGNAGEVVCFSYLLDVGNIQESFDSEYRRNFIFSRYTQSGWDNSQEFFDNIRAGIRRNTEEYDRFLEFLEKEEEIRIWYSHAPYSLCGLYWLCSKLYHATNRIYVVELPEYRERENNTIVRYKNWGEISAEEFSSFLPLQRELSENERRMFAHEWTELTEDNSPLRVAINEKIVGVPEDFYDFLIRKRITTEPIKEARLIGDILGRYPVNVSDWWYAARIEQMIENGEIKIVQDSEQKYTRIIRLAKEE